jgi:ABC-2 type transport system permease protein
VNDRTPSAKSEGEFLSIKDEAGIFWRVRRQTLRVLVRQALAQARFRLGLIVLLSMLLWGGLFWLFADGFAFIKAGRLYPDMYEQMVRGVFGMFFAALMVMLVFSSGIILYGSLFRSPEVGFLLTVPARTGRVFLHKFQEAVLLSSWAFILLGSPMLLAYGIVADAPWYFYVVLFPFMFGFVYVPAAVGAILCLLIMYWLPSRRVHLLVFGGVGVVAGLILFGWSLMSIAQSDALTPGWFQELLWRIQFTDTDLRLLPSWWLASGLLQAAGGVWSEGVMFLCLIFANALFFRQVAVWVAERVYRAAYSSLYGSHNTRKLTRVPWIDRATMQLTGFLPTEIRLLLVKDSRLFRRDPVQWSQFLIFFALLALYFLNIRHFSYRDQFIGWVNMIAFLNLSVVGLLMSTFTTRFIFPLISLEGSRFWVLGLLPVPRDTILWGKFAFSVGASIVPCSGLILLSDVMLGVPPLIVASHQLTCLILCFGLSGIAVGLGARLPNLREQSPSRIAAGFGGTLNLVVSTAYILVIVLLTALPCHFYLAAVQAQAAGLGYDVARLQGGIRFWFLGGTVVSVLLGGIATVVPLVIGFRSFRQLEF